MRTLSLSDIDLLRRLPAFEEAEIDGAIPFALLHPLLDLGLDLYAEKSTEIFAIRAIAPSHTPNCVRLEHTGGEQVRNLLTMLLCEQDTLRFFELVAIDEVSSDLPF